MGHAVSSLTHYRLQREMQKALVATALQFGDALRRFDTHRRRCGHDYWCSRLLDEVRLSRKLLLLLADEVGRGGGYAGSPN